MSTFIRNIPAGRNERELEKPSSLPTSIVPAHIHDDRRWSYRLVNGNFYAGRTKWKSGIICNYFYVDATENAMFRRPLKLLQQKLTRPDS